MVFSETDCAYLAGLIDGDGCITIISGNREYHGSPRISISNCDKELLETIQDKFGGRLIVSNRKGKSNWKTRYALYWTKGGGGIKIMKAIYPYLIRKKRQVEVCIEFNSMMDQHGRGGAKFKIPEEHRIRRTGLIGEIRILNKRGVEQ